ncbi:uncharacterized protein [Littorina saxatilis]|uniref:Secreted protein n=1 Tax=Littorina saxatilis TaxID=31220 RepID=A0AAN9C2T2_9CAEN
MTVFKMNLIIALVGITLLSQCRFSEINAASKVRSLGTSIRRKLLLLLILREKCQQWRDQGVNPLPRYCFLVRRPNAGRAMSTSRVNGFYNQYTRRVSGAERRRALGRARQRLAMRRN